MWRRRSASACGTRARGSAPPCALNFQDSVAAADFVHYDAVGSKIGDEEGVAVGRQVDRMGVGPFLPGRVGSFTMMLVEPAHFTQTSVREDRIQGDVSTAVIGRYQPPAARIDRQVARPIPTGRSLVDGLDSKRLGIEAQCPYLSVGSVGLTGLAHRVE